MLTENADMKFELIDSADTATLEIVLGKDKGSFTLSPDTYTQRLVLFSPISANSYKYRFDTVNQRWIADSDNHIFEELFVREMITSDLKGFPQL